jgi:hypothetical protein
MNTHLNDIVVFCKNKEEFDVVQNFLLSKGLSWGYYEDKEKNLKLYDLEEKVFLTNESVYIYTSHDTDINWHYSKNFLEGMQYTAQNLMGIKRKKEYEFSEFRKIFILKKTVKNFRDLYENLNYLNKIAIKVYNHEEFDIAQKFLLQKGFHWDIDNNYLKKLEENFFEKFKYCHIITSFNKYDLYTLCWSIDIQDLKHHVYEFDNFNEFYIAKKRIKSIKDMYEKKHIKTYESFLKKFFYGEDEESKMKFDGLFERIEDFTEGTRIRVVKTLENPGTNTNILKELGIPAGTVGTVMGYDRGSGTIVMKWDNGSSLNLLWPEDKKYITQE